LAQTRTAILEKIAKRGEMVEFYLVDVDGTGNVFETEGVITAIPDLLLTTDDKRVHRFEITDIIFYMNPTAAETYEILLFEGAFAGDVKSLAQIVWRSGAAMVDSTPYIRTNNEDELPKIVELSNEGLLYYMMLWTGAPGNTPGYIKVRGRKLA